MKRLLLFPVKFLGFAALGFGLAVGWKLGSCLVNVALDKETRERFFEWTGVQEGSAGEPLWKRKFSRVSEP